MENRLTDVIADNSHGDDDHVSRNAEEGVSAGRDKS